MNRPQTVYFFTAIAIKVFAIAMKVFAIAMKVFVSIHFFMRYVGLYTWLYVKIKMCSQCSATQTGMQKCFNTTRINLQPRYYQLHP